MSEATGHAEDHGHGGMGHAVGWPILVGVWLALMGLTFITVAVTYVDLGPLNIIIAMGVATVKAALVVMFFMHLFWDKPLNSIVFFLSIAFVGVFLAFTIIDTKQYQGAIAQLNADKGYKNPEPEPKVDVPTPNEEEKPVFDKVKALLESGAGDAAAGKAYFTANCATCHKLEGAGADIGPDLSDYHRDNLDLLLMAVLFPSKQIREGYENYNFRTKEQGVLIGTKKDNPDGTFTVKTGDGKTYVLKKEDLKANTEPKKLTVSLMPDGLLDGKTEDDIRNLFEYLKSVPVTAKK